jgi:hypothetical protein
MRRFVTESIIGDEYLKVEYKKTHKNVGFGQNGGDSD